MGCTQNRNGAKALADNPTPQKSMCLMDTPPATPQERAEIVNLTVSATDFSTEHAASEVTQQLPPPSPASAYCDAPPEVLPTLHPMQPPAWESKGEPLAQSLGGMAATDPAVPTTAPTASGNLAAASSSSSQDQREAPPAPHAAVAPPVDHEIAANHVALGGYAANLQPALLSASGSMPEIPSGSLPPPSTAGTATPRTAPAEPARTASSRAFFSTVEHAGADNVRTLDYQSAVSSGIEHPSARSANSGIFDLEIPSPGLSGAAPAPPTGVRNPLRIEVAEGDFPLIEVDIVGPRIGPAATRAGGSAGGVFSHGQERQVYRDSSSPPRPYAPLRGPWERLQEVIDEIKDFSPHDVSSGMKTSSPRVTPAPHTDPSAPAATPSVEEHKGGVSRVSAEISTLYEPSSTFHPLHGGGEGKGQGQGDSPQHPRSPSPSSPVAVVLVTSPPTPASSSHNVPSTIPPEHHDAPRLQRGAWSMQELSDSIAAAEQHATLVARPGTTETTPVVERGTAGRSGVSEAAPASEAAAEGRSTDSVVESGAVGRGEETSSSGSTNRSGFDTGWGRGFGIREGELDPEDVFGTSVARWESGRGRGLVGERFIRAAEAINDSPQLRRAAGAAAAAVTSAAGTARVTFTTTSRTIGKVLAASAKSFEEFVDEQLREDGCGQVLRREGATGLLVPRGKTLTQAFVVASGCYLCWEFRVKDHDLGFALRLRSQGIGGSTEEDIFEMRRYASGKTYQGRWTAEGDSTAIVVMVWDNSYSCLRPKNLAYKAQVLRPGVDAAAPPPTPPSTPANIAAATLFGRTFDTRGGGGNGMEREHEIQRGEGPHAAYTEAFVIDESEGEDPAFSENIQGGRGDRRGDEGGGGGEGQDRTRDYPTRGNPMLVTVDTGVSPGGRRRRVRQSSISRFSEGRKEELEEKPWGRWREGSTDRGLEKSPDSIPIEEFFATTHESPEGAEKSEI